MTLIAPNSGTLDDEHYDRKIKPKPKRMKSITAAGGSRKYGQACEQLRIDGQNGAISPTTHIRNASSGGKQVNLYFQK